MSSRKQYFYFALVCFLVSTSTYFWSPVVPESIILSAAIFLAMPLIALHEYYNYSIGKEISFLQLHPNKDNTFGNALVLILITVFLFAPIIYILGYLTGAHGHS